MKIVAVTLLVGVVALGGCGESDDSGAAQAPAESGMAVEANNGNGASADGTIDAATEKRRGPSIRVADSQFGSMLVDGKRQAIYIFENDPRGGTVCYGECAKAWPPVLTSGTPRAGAGVRKKLLGTVRRRNGKRQVTYAGKPLYFYAHEAPGEVLCHNVNLNGGYWWVIGPTGKRRP